MAKYKKPNKDYVVGADPEVKPWRPKNWLELKAENYGMTVVDIDGCDCTACENFEAGADAIIKSQKSNGLYGEYGKDFIVSSRVKPDDKDWAEVFFATLTGKGHLVFISDEDSDENTLSKL